MKLHLSKQCITCILCFFLIGATSIKAQWTELGGNNSLAANAQIITSQFDASGNMYIAGDFTNGNAKRYVAKWNGTSWSELGGTNASTFNSTIQTMIKDASGNIYVAGDFTNGNAKRYVAKWNGTSWSELGGTNASTFNGTIYGMVADAFDNIYISGRFSNGNSKRYVAKWNGTAWSEIGGTNTSTFPSDLFCLSVDALGNIYAAGNLFNGINKRYVAKWNGTSWGELGGTNTSTFNGGMSALTTDASGNVYVAGKFSNTVGFGKTYVAQWNGTTWSEVGGTNTSTFNSEIYFIKLDASGNMYIGGNFNNGNAKKYVAKFNGTAWSELGGTGTSTFNNDINSVSLDALGNVYASGRFLNSSSKFYVAQYITSVACVPNSSLSTATICATELPYTWNGLTFNAAGTQTVHYTNAGGCDSAANYTLTVTTPSPASVNVFASNNNVCAGTNITFTAIATNGGSNPSFQWKRNGNNIGFNSSTFNSSFLGNNDSIWCVITSNATCITTTTASSAKIKMQIKPAPAAPIIPASSVIIGCSIGSSTSMFCNYWNTTWSSSNPAVASVTYPGPAGTNGTYVNGVGNGTTTITVTTTSPSNGCSNSASILYTVAAVSDAGTLICPSGVCLNSSIVVTSTVDGGLWSFSNNKALVNSAGIITGNSVGNGVLTYKVINGQGCFASVTKNISTYALPVAPTVSSLNAAKPYCKGATYTVNASPSNGAWTVSNATTSAPTGTPVLVTLGNTVGPASLTYTITDANGCTANRVITANVGNCVGSRAANVVAEPTYQQINLYPNPAKGVVSLQVDKLVGKGTVVITDIYGKVVYSSIVNNPSTKVDISHLNKGLYLVSMITSEGKMMKKLIVE